MTRKSIPSNIVISFLVLITSFLYLRSGVDLAPFHLDEVGKISDSYYYHLFFEKHDLSNPAWTEDFYARTNPPVAKYIMGLGLAFQGYHITNLDLQKAFEMYWHKPAVLREHISPGLLNSARSVSVVFGAFSCLLVYLIGCSLGGVVLGLLCAFLMLFHPLFTIYSRLALTDSILLFFMTLIVILASCHVQSAVRSLNDSIAVSKKKQFSCFFLLGTLLPGLAIALAAGTKLNGGLSGFFFLLVTLGAVLLVLFFNGWRISKRKKGLLLLYLCSAIFGLVLSLTIFVSINPYLYSNPIHKMFHTLQVYDDWMLKQMIDPGEPLFLWRQKIAATGYFHFFKSNLAILYSLDGFYATSRFILFSIGVGMTLIRMIRQTRNGVIPGREYVTICWLLVYGIGIMAWVPLCWPRYFLPLTPVFTVFMGIGLVSMTQLVRQVLLNRIRKKNDLKMKGTNYYGHIRRTEFFLIVILILGGFIEHRNRIAFDPSTLPPTVFSSTDHDSLRRLYGEAITNRPEDPTSHFNMADFMFINNQPDKAVFLYQKGMDLVKKRNMEELYSIKIVTIEYKLFRAFVSLGRNSDAVIILDKHLSRLKQITSELKTSDSKVCEEFDRIINYRQSILMKLRKTLGRN